MIALPQGVVGVLDRQRRQFNRLPFGMASIERSELVEQHLDRPTVGDDVMQAEHQYMLLRAHFDERHTPGRALFQIEGTSIDTIDLLLQLRLVLRL